MATARLNREYAIRMTFVGALLAALALWSVYDGAVAWPRANRQLASVRPFLAEYSAKAIMTPEAWLSATDEAPDSFPLRDAFAKAGVPLTRKLVQELSEITHPEGNEPELRRARAERADELFSRDLYPAGKCQGQFVQAAVLAILALLAFNAVWSKRGTEYVVDENGLSGNGFGAAPVPWSDVKSVDWGRWESKGVIAVKAAGGRRFVLDGWHFKGIRDIAAVLEERYPRS